MGSILEICIDTFESAQAAVEGGADRLEVCSCLSADGLTPSYGLVERCRSELDIDLMMMVRPHDGGFVYGSEDVETMAVDIRMARSLGVDGIVFGALTKSNRVDQETCKRLIGVCEDVEATFHRAFDLVSEPFGALDEIEQLGFARVLTSGLADSALAGSSLIRQLVGRAINVRIVAGAGINPNNIDQVVAESGASEFHASASKQVEDTQAGRNVSFGSNRLGTDSELVRAIKNRLL